MDKYEFENLLILLALAASLTLSIAYLNHAIPREAERFKRWWKSNNTHGPNADEN